MIETTIREFVSRQELFRDLHTRFLNQLVESARCRTLAENDILFRHGDAADHFYLLRSGHITVEIPAIEGPRLEVQKLGPGQVLGWSWLIPPYQWNFQARALEESEVVEFDGATIRQQCEDDPAFGYEVLKRFSNLMSARLEAARRRMMEEWKPAGFA
ncbi:MAG: cyclic nucleotide-binding domain-containing protein, partial [Ectothiorhodospiraceae bacterium]